MNKFRLAGVAVTAIVASPISAYALNFDFSFTGAQGDKVTGEIFGLATSGSSAATNLIIDSDGLPAGNEPTPFDFFTHMTHNSANAFTVSNGAIIGAHFFGSFKVPPNLFPYLALNQKTTGGTANKYANSKGVTSIGGGFAAITFTPVGAAAAAPEPASIALLGAGLVGISAFRRRRRRHAA